MGKLPTKIAMAGEIKKMQEWKRKEMPNAGGARAYMIQTHQVHYYDQLLKDMGVSIRRKLGLFAGVKEVFEPYRPRDYCTVITGEFKHKKGENTVPGDNQAPFWHEGLIV